MLADTGRSARAPASHSRLARVTRRTCVRMPFHFSGATRISPHAMNGSAHSSYSGHRLVGFPLNGGLSHRSTSSHSPGASKAGSQPRRLPPVSLRDTITGLDENNAARLLAAIRHASGNRPTLTCALSNNPARPTGNWFDLRGILIHFNHRPGKIDS